MANLMQNIVILFLRSEITKENTKNNPSYFHLRNKHEANEERWAFGNNGEYNSS